MKTATVFKSGNSQAVRIPKDFRFEENELAINKVGDIVMIMTKNSKWTSFIMGASLFSDDFMKDGRVKDQNQVREPF